MNTQFSGSLNWLSQSRLFKSSAPPSDPQTAQPQPTDDDEYDLVELPKLGPQGKANLSLAALLGSIIALASVIQPTPKPESKPPVTPPTVQTNPAQTKTTATGTESKAKETAEKPEASIP